MYKKSVSKTKDFLVLLTFICLDLIMLSVHHNAVDGGDAQMRNLYYMMMSLMALVLGSFTILSILFLIRNQRGIGNRILIKEEILVFPKMHFLISFLPKKEFFIPVSEINNILVDHSEVKRFKTIIFRVSTNKKEYIIREPILKL